MGSVVLHDIMYSGKSSKDKRVLIKNSLNKKDMDAIFISAPENLCWTFNLRGNDVPMTPIAFGYAIIEKNGDAKIFIKKKMIILI